MRITDQELTITEILDVRKGTIPISTPSTSDRHSDCFVYVLSGHAEYTFGSKTISAEKGNIIYLAHHSKYHISVEVPDYHYINVDFLFAGREGTVYSNEIYKASNLPALETAYLNLKKFWDIGNFADKIQCKAIVYQTYAEIAHASLTGYLSSDRRARLEASVQLMSEQYSDPDFSVAQLSEMCRISEVHYRRLFQQLYHTSPVRFLILLRIGRAKELLNSTELPIFQIAECCGFQSAYYFSKVFRETTGMTPSEYRRAYLLL